MDKMFGQMMQGFFSGLSDQDKQNMKACCEKMVAMCPCMNMKGMSGNAGETAKEGAKETAHG